MRKIATLSFVLIVITSTIGQAVADIRRIPPIYLNDQLWNLSEQILPGENPKGKDGIYPKLHKISFGDEVNCGMHFKILSDGKFTWKGENWEKSWSALEKLNEDQAEQPGTVSVTYRFIKKLADKAHWEWIIYIQKTKGQIKVWGERNFFYPK